MHRAAARFWDSYGRLPEPAKKTARQNFDLLKSNHRHPSLHFKRIGKFWSARAGLNYWALAVDDGPDFVWVWIGPHDEYENLV